MIRTLQRSRPRAGDGSAPARGILDGLRVLEGSAYVAAPLGGMTLAQLGADVIRFDPIGGGLDRNRWPVTDDGKSMFWAGLNKGKRSIQVDLGSQEGRELIAEMVARPGEEAGMLLTNFPARGWLAYEKLCERREDLIMVSIDGNYDGTSAVDYTINPATGFPWATGPRNLSVPVQPPAAGLGCDHRQPRRGGAAGGRAPPPADRRGPAGQGGALRRRLRDGRQPRQDRRGPGLPPRAQKEGNYLYGAFGRDFLTKDEHRIMIVALTSRQWTGPGRGHRPRGGVRLGRAGDGRRPEQGGRPLRRPRGAGGDPQALDDRPHHGRDPRGLRREGVCWGPYQTFMELVDHDPRCSTENPMFERGRATRHRHLPDGRLAPPIQRLGPPAPDAAPRSWASTPTRSWPGCWT